LKRITGKKSKVNKARMNKPKLNKGISSTEKTERKISVKFIFVIILILTALIMIGIRIFPKISKIEVTIDFGNRRS